MKTFLETAGFIGGLVFAVSTFVGLCWWLLEDLSKDIFQAGREAERRRDKLNGDDYEI